MNALTEIDRVLIVVAHPDDETIGCGGLIKVLSKRGVDVHLLVLGSGVGARSSNELAAQKKLRVRSMQNACQILGIKERTVLDFPDNRFDSVPLLEVVQSIEKVATIFNPQLVITHHYGDVNIDHEVTSRATVTAFRSYSSLAKDCKSVMFFEIPSSSSQAFQSRGKAFVPNIFMDVTAALDAKIRACHEYTSEMRAEYHPLSIQQIENCARVRGAEIGVHSAEAFELAYLKMAFP